MLKNAALSIVALVLCGVAVELCLRLAGYQYVSFHRYDENVGATLNPAAEGVYDKEGSGYIRVNSYGFRGPEWSIAKGNNTLRVAVLGDSYTEAMQVDESATFWHLAEQNLQNNCPLVKAAGLKVEFLNFGVSGHGTVQNLQMYRHHAARFNPDIVVVAFLTGNDIRNNSSELESAKQRPFAYIEQGKLQIDDSFNKSFKAESRRYLPEWLNRLRVYQLVNEARGSLANLIAAREAARNPGQQNNPGLDEHVYQAPTGDWLDAWRITEAALLEIRAEMVADHRRLLVMTLTNPDQVNPDLQARAETLASLRVESLDYPDRRLAAFFEANGIAYLTLLDKFEQELSNKPGSYFHGFENTQLGSGHWNETGHALAGQALASRLCEPAFLRR